MTQKLSSLTADEFLDNILIAAYARITDMFRK